MHTTQSSYLPFFLLEWLKLPHQVLLNDLISVRIAAVDEHLSLDYKSWPSVQVLTGGYYKGVY